MINNILDIINKNIIINNQPVGVAIIDLFFIMKYGNSEGAQFFFSELKQQCNTEEEFNNLILQQIENDLNVKKFQALGDVFSNKSNFNTFLNINKNIENWFINSNFSREELETLKKLKDLTESLFIEHFHPDPEILRKLLIGKIADKITFTIKETREEIGFKNQRTFKKWLSYFYKDKFDGRKTINILEYLDIWNKFLLSTNENTIDIKKKADEYKKRIDDGLIFSKKRLNKLTKGHYKLLKIEIDNINKEQGLQLPNDVDMFPYSIVEIFKKYLI